MDSQYHHYQGLMIVARNEQMLQTCRPQPQKVAVYYPRCDIHYEEILGKDSYLRRLQKIAIGIEQAGDEFLLIPPQGMLPQAPCIH
jgi:hypothetical protein